MTLKENDAIRTLIESETELETSEGTIIKIGENTTVELSALKGNGAVQNTKLKILNGSILANVKKLVNTKSTFSFETPTATAAIRGTVVNFDVGSSKTVIKVFEGKVWVTPQGSTQGAELKDRQMTVVEKGQKSIVILDIPEDMIPKDTSSGQTDSTVVPDSSLNTDPDLEQLPDTVPEEDSSVAPEPTSINLEVSKPAENSKFTVGEAVHVEGTVSPGNSIVSVNGKSIKVDGQGIFKTELTAPSKEGDYRIKISADYKALNAGVERQIVVAPVAAGLVVASPVEGLVVNKPVVSVSGTASAGAVVTAGGIKLAVQANGAFRGEVPLPDEEGAVQIEIEMFLEGGRSTKLVRNITYKPDLQFNISVPAEGQVFNTTSIPLKGELIPRGAELMVNGRKVQVTSGGPFAGMYVIHDQEGEVTLEFEALYGSQSVKMTRKVVYKRSVDMNKPLLQGVLPEVSRQRKLAFTVIDRTTDEEISFHREIDGMKEVERGPANSPFYVVLEDGIHSYAVYAADKAGNQTQRITRKVAYLESPVWQIKLRKPAGDLVIHVPPSAPDQSFQSRYTIEMSVEKLPGNDPALIKEIVFSNSATGESVPRRNLTTVDVECELALDRKKPNLITVQVRDINDIVKTRQFTINVR